MAKEAKQTEEKRWYILQAMSGKEAKVVRVIKEMIRVKDMEDKFGEIVIPTEEVVELKKGQKRKSERKFFPGYILIEMVMNNTTWQLVRNVPGVLGFIGGRGITSDNQLKIPSISEEEVNHILQRVQEGAEKPKPKIVFQPGEVVRIIDGPFADFDGVVEDVNYEKNRLRVSVLIFGRSTPVELEFGQVQKS